MSNEKNLIPFNERTESEQREIAQKGGIASGAARRRKRSMRQAADYYLSLPETDRRRVNAMLRDQIEPEDVDNQMAVIVGIAEGQPSGGHRPAEDAGRGDRAGGPGRGCSGKGQGAAGRCGQCH